MHAIGDRAVRNALDACEAARDANGARDARHHVAHLQVIHPDDVPRFRELGVVANCQPYWAQHDPQMDELTIPFLGPDRAPLQYPFGSLHAAGAMLAFGSDWSVSTADPLEEMEVAIRRPIRHPGCRTVPPRPAPAAARWPSPRSRWVPPTSTTTTRRGASRRAPRRPGRPRPKPLRRRATPPWPTRRWSTRSSPAGRVLRRLSDRSPSVARPLAVRQTPTADRRGGASRWPRKGRSIS